MFERYTLRQVTPTFLSPQTGQCMRILPPPRNTLWWLLFFSSRNWSYQYEPLDKVDTVQSVALLLSNTLTLCSSALTLCTQQCFHRLKWTNHMSTCLRFGKVTNGADVPFHNSIIGIFVVYQSRIETDLLKLCAHPENSEWFSVISVVICEVEIVAEQKQTWLAMIFLFF